MTRTKALINFCLQIVSAFITGIRVILLEDVRVTQIFLESCYLYKEEIEAMDRGLCSIDYDPADVAFKYDDEDEEDELPPRKVSTR
jgi:hypothetical protein